MLTLYDRPACPYCWKVRIALALTGLAHEKVTVTDNAQIEGLGPQATAPILTDGDLVLWDSGAIAEYVDGVSGGALMPKDPGGAARVRLLQTYSDQLIGPAGFRDVVMEKRNKPEAEWDQEVLQKGEAGWRVCLDWLEAQIDGPDGFVGDGLSLADCALFPRFAMAAKMGIGVDDRHPKLQAWFAARKGNPAFSGTAPG